MKTNLSNGRPWTWTPPPAMNWVMTTILRTPGLHRLVSKMILLIIFTGRKSGKRYVIPVGYHREGDGVTILTKRFRQWWHNFEEPISVMLRIEGRNYIGEAVALTDSEKLIPIITQIVETHHREAKIYAVKLLENGRADMNSIRELAPKVVIIQGTLYPEPSNR